MKEIETKIYTIDPLVIRKKLASLGAKPVKNVFLKNTYFKSHETKKRELSVRIRDDGTTSVFTVKGKRAIVNGHKVQDEYEVVVDGTAMRDALLLMGYTVRAYVEMKREYYSLMGCSVEICKLPGCPEYLEIEGAPGNINRVAAALGFSKKDFDNTAPKEKFNIPKIMKRWTF